MNERQQDLHELELESASQLDPVAIKSVRHVLLLLKAWGMPMSYPNQHARDY
jgi:hypothetical protein